MFLDKLSQREKTLIGCLALAAICYFYYQWVLTPRFYSLKAERQRSRDLTEILSRSREATAQLSSWREAAADAEREAKELPLPETADLGLFLQEMNRIAVASKVKITSVAPAGKSVELEYYKVPVSVGLSGTYSGAVAFFGSLRHSDSPFVVTGVKLMNMSDGKGDPRLRIDFSGFTLLNRAGGVPDAGR